MASCASVGCRDALLLTLFVGLGKRAARWWAAPKLRHVSACTRLGMCFSERGVHVLCVISADMAEGGGA